MSREKRVKDCLCGKNGHKLPEGGLCGSCFTMYGPILGLSEINTNIQQSFEAMDIILDDLKESLVITQSDMSDFEHLYREHKQLIEKLMKLKGLK